MADVLTLKQRSFCMSRIKGKNTKPEILVRSLIHSMGYRFRLHRADLPGKPDIVLSKYRSVILIHGCFWHMHHCSYGNVVPKTNADFWSQKRQGNVQRDTRNVAALRKAGWRVLILWECETRNIEKLKKKVAQFFAR